MSISMFYSLDTMTVNQWFSMLANESLGHKEVESKDVQDGNTLVYEVNASDSFKFNEDYHHSGIYYLRARPDQVEDLSESACVRKLSFSELVYLSDIFSTIVNNLIPETEELDKLIEKGEASRYFEAELDTVPSKGLEIMRERVWTKYFDQGLMGIVRRFFSAIANLFRKYNANAVMIETGIYWPGNSCHYADQVVRQLNRIKSVFICYAYEASKENLSKYFGLSVEELEELEINDLKKRYHKLAVQLHPDKNPNDPIKAEEFQLVNRAWGDFVQLGKLKEQYQSQIDELDNELSDSEEDLDEDASYKKKLIDDSNPLASHQFKHMLSLPAPIAVS